MTVKACLVDVYDTILNSDFKARVRALTALVDVDPDVWLDEWLTTHIERDVGKLSIAGALAVTLRACGVEPAPELVGDLARVDAELMRRCTRVYDDTVPFFARLRSKGIVTALVSNCGDTTRSLLEYLGVIPLADEVILSCEAGFAKPSPQIYVRALEGLGVAAADAIMIDDQARFCVGAEAVGVRAIQIVRADLAADRLGQPAREPGFPVVATLLDALALL